MADSIEILLQRAILCRLKALTEQPCPCPETEEPNGNGNGNGTPPPCEEECEEIEESETITLTAGVWREIAEADPRRATLMVGIVTGNSIYISTRQRTGNAGLAVRIDQTPWTFARSIHGALATNALWAMSIAGSEITVLERRCTRPPQPAPTNGTAVEDASLLGIGTPYRIPF